MLPFPPPASIFSEFSYAPRLELVKTAAVTISSWHYQITGDEAPAKRGRCWRKIPSSSSPVTTDTDAGQVRLAASSTPPGGRWVGCRRSSDFHGDRC